MLLLLLLLLRVLLRRRGCKTRSALSALSRHYTAKQVSGSVADRGWCGLRRWCAAMAMGTTCLQLSGEARDFILVPSRRH